jgi:hypothetical protein
MYYINRQGVHAEYANLALSGVRGARQASSRPDSRILRLGSTRIRVGVRKKVGICEQGARTACCSTAARCVLALQPISAAAERN